MRKQKGRRNKGTTMIEFAAACALGLPLIMVMLYATLEVNYLFAIRTNLDVATRRAAQLLISQYVSTGTVTPDVAHGNLPSSMAFDVPTSDGHYFIHKSASQFTWTWDLSTRPITVTVTVSYPTSPGGSQGLLPFPNPDPLKLGSNMVIYTSGTFSAPG